MKRITLLMVAFLGSIALQAQTVLFEQQPDGTTGFLSDYFDLTPAGLYSADDFEITTQSEVTEITIHGFQNAGTLMTYLTGFSLYVYADNAGVPDGNPTVTGSGLLEIVDLSTSDAALTIDTSSLASFTVDIVAANGSALNLTAGTYWVVAVAHMDQDVSSQAWDNQNTWYWLASTSSNLSDCMVYDADGILGTGPTWTPVNLVVGDPTFAAYSFSINGQSLSTDNPILAEISLYPNPVQDQLNISLPASVELEAATMFDLLGQATQMNVSDNNTLNTANLAPGVYVLKLETTQGNLTQKVIKK